MDTAMKPTPTRTRWAGERSIQRRVASRHADRGLGAGPDQPMRSHPVEVTIATTRAGSVERSMTSTDESARPR